ncbi:hypothetical protein A3A39_01205 [Candidatus Kaiserbacteria bacterium RIFCSPLOWO2_01_FULL_54_13]|uniref:Branched-chain amino acid ABC transporter permease n=1 Tax=Candidatus Kaiserbacteria bacterium RIFCSPLOWO2_01_FULL_54_13 TaxID=1798512 RepID=A0A1F6F297_9BACT|nr:MAG: hypothetical protein A3A39_01205 [Candidatus Kaiserbacteria bacterium RIFCSPLOWO2_01_FULL_54_13]
MDIAAQLILNAIIAGAIYSLLALGFNLLYSTARFFDLGYGAMSVAGAYVAYTFYNLLDLSVPIAVLAGVLAAGTLGFVVEKLVYRPLRARKATHTVLLIASLGVLIVIQAVISIIFSSQFKILSKDVNLEPVFNVFGGAITQTQVIILVAALLIMVALALTLKYTLFGKAVNAIADDEEVARVVGVNSERVIGVVFFVGSAIGGAAGIATAFDSGIYPTIGLPLLLNGVIAFIVGGVGNVYGAVLGAFALAITENAAAWFLPGEWKFAIAFLVLIIFLIFRPQGILPK